MCSTMPRINYQAPLPHIQSILRGPCSYSRLNQEIIFLNDCAEIAFCLLAEGKLWENPVIGYFLAIKSYVQFAPVATEELEADPVDVSESGMPWIPWTPGSCSPETEAWFVERCASAAEDNASGTDSDLLPDLRSYSRDTSAGPHPAPPHSGHNYTTDSDSEEPILVSRSVSVEENDSGTASDLLPDLVDRSSSGDSYRI